MGHVLVGGRKDGEPLHFLLAAEAVDAKVAAYPVNPGGQAEAAVVAVGFEPKLDKDILCHVFRLLVIS